MSLRDTPLILTAESFPRVSGDEPGHYGFGTLDGGFSPRERG